MEKVSFFSVFFSNLKCAFCEKKFCEVRYFPQRRNSYFYNGRKYFVQCEKDVDEYYDKMFKL